MTSTLSRRSFARGTAWAAPALTVAAVAPASAASHPAGTACGTISYPASGAAAGAIVPIALSNGTTVYAKFSPSTAGSTQDANTAAYNARFGKSAYGSVRGTYTISQSANFVFNQVSTRPSNESLTVSFFSDPAATKAVAVTKVSVPINDLSTGVSWSCAFLDTGCSTIANKSYQDVVTMTATTSSGTTITATSNGLTGAQAQNATTPALTGDLASGMYLPAANALNSPSSAGTSYGGTLNTTFGSAAITSFTFGYRSNAENSTSGFSGDQGISLAPFTVCQ